MAMHGIGIKLQNFFEEYCDFSYLYEHVARLN